MRSPKQPSWSGVERANLFVLILLGLQRASYLLPPLVSHGSGYASPGLTPPCWRSRGVEPGAVHRGRRRGWFAPWMAWLDVAWACVLAVAVAVAANLPPDQYDGPLNWSGRTSQAAAALAGSAAGGLGLTVLAVAVPKDHDLAALGEAIREVAGGGTAFSPELAHALLHDRRPQRPQLSRQERAVLLGYASGMTSRRPPGTPASAPRPPVPTSSG
jgi:hypothetical protein